MINPILFANIVVLVLVFGVLFYFALDLKKQREKPQDDASLKIMMEWMKEIKQGTDQTRMGMQKSIDRNQ